MTRDVTGLLAGHSGKLRIRTNLQIYWDNILIDRSNQTQSARINSVPLARADLRFHGFPLKVECKPPGNVKYMYETVSATGPYTRPAGAYTRYGDVRPRFDSHANEHRDRDRHAAANCDRHAGADGDGHADGNRDRHARTNGYRHASPDSDRHAGADGN